MGSLLSDDTLSWLKMSISLFETSIELPVTVEFLTLLARLGLLTERPLPDAESSTL